MGPFRDLRLSTMFLILLNMFIYFIVVNALNFGINARADTYLSTVKCNDKYYNPFKSYVKPSYINCTV
jgi:hypothetical protein